MARLVLDFTCRPQQVTCTQEYRSAAQQELGEQECGETAEERDRVLDGRGGSSGCVQRNPNAADCVRLGCVGGGTPLCRHFPCVCLLDVLSFTFSHFFVVASSQKGLFPGSCAHFGFSKFPTAPESHRTPSAL